MDVTLVLVFIFAINGCLAVKIALMPQFGRSHYMVMSKLAQELIKRGHDVSILLGEDAAYAFGKPAVKIFQIPAEERDANERLVKRVSGNQAATPLEVFRGLMKVQQHYCDSFLSSPEMIAEVRDADVLIGDGLYACSALVADKFDLPHVVLNTFPVCSPFLNIFGHLVEPSYVPQMMSALPRNMGLLDRVKNLVFFVGNIFLVEFIQIPVYKELKEKHNIKPLKTIKETMATIDLILLETEFALDHPQPILPNMREVGCFLPVPAEPLSAELEDFMQSSGNDGVILVSFGSMVDTLSDDIISVMTNAFAKIPQKILWKIKLGSSSGELPPNIKVATWLPQNDILGHQKTKLFITHAGTNGIAEAAYHGVPMICSPFFGDQFDNSQRIKDIGMGEIQAVRDATAEQLIGVVAKVIHGKSYKEKSKHISNVMKKRKRSPTEEAADLIEYVQALRDMSHLKPRGLGLPFYKRYMLDVLLLIGVALALFLAIFIRLIQLVVKICLGVTRKTKTS